MLHTTTHGSRRRDVTKTEHHKSPGEISQKGAIVGKKAPNGKIECGEGQLALKRRQKGGAAETKEGARTKHLIFLKKGPATYGPS